MHIECRRPRARGLPGWWLAAGLVALAAFLGGDAAPLEAQAGGTIAGVVRDVESGQSLETAVVSIPELGLGGLTNARGRFLLLDVPPGTYELQVDLIGYLPHIEQVTVSPGNTVPLEIGLTVTALRLQELVVTGVAGATPRVKLPFTVERIDVDEMPVPQANPGALVQAKLPGVTVVRGSGQPGEDASIMLRGPTTLTGTVKPLIIVDGVITDNRLSEIDALDIESIEIVKGAAAASLYGSRAQNGVIQIQTKRGSGLRTGQSRVTLRSEVGFQELGKRLEKRRGHAYRVVDGSFVDQDGNPVPFGPGAVLDRGPNEVAFNDKPWPIPTYDHVDQFFDPGEFINEYVAVEGRSGGTNYRASFSFNREEGILLQHQGFTRRNFRMNVDHQVWDNLDVSLSSFFAKSWQDDLGINGLSGLAGVSPPTDLLATGPDGKLLTYPDPLSPLSPNILLVAAERDAIQDRGRFMGSASVRFEPLDWLGFEAAYSFDRADFENFLQFPKEHPNGTPTGDLGRLRRDHNLTSAANTSITASIRKSWGDLSTRTRLRYLLEDQHFESLRAQGTEFAVAEVPVLDNLIGEPIITSSITDVVSEGYFLVSALDFKGKYIGDFLIRRDGSSLFGPDERWATYFRGSFAWRLTQEGWWPSALDVIDELKVRYSWGQAGGRPRFEAQYETYAVREGIVAPQNLGNRSLKPELTTEQEYGLDFVLWNRLSGSVIYADATTEDLLALRPLPGFAGFTEQWSNVGSIESSTWEGYLEASIVETPDLAWSMRLGIDRTRQTITDLKVAPFYRTGPAGFSDGREGGYWFREGGEVGTISGTRWATTCADLQLMGDIDCSQLAVNRDGFLVPTGGAGVGDGIASSLWGSTVTIGTDGEGQPIEREWGIPLPSIELVDGKPESLLLALGSSAPDFAASWSNTLRWKNLALYTLFHTEQGFDIRDFDVPIHNWCDMLGVPDEDKLPLRYCNVLRNSWPGNQNVEDGSYIKLREASLRYTFDRDGLGDLGDALGLDRLSLTAIGRNLLTWSDYRGWDPEVGAIGFEDVAAVARAARSRFPHFRQYTFAVELVF